MSEVVERVARALFEADCQIGDTPIVKWELAPEYEREEYRHLARAALEALREPTEGMVEAGADAADASGWAVDAISGAKTAYRAMIDEALK